MSTDPGEMPLALLDMDESQRVALRTRLQSLDHECIGFSNAGDAILALSSGLRFGLLLAVLRDETSLEGLSAACLVLGIPVLVVVANGQWGLLASQGNALESTGAVRADVSRITDTELDGLVRVLTQRTPPAIVAAAPTSGETVWGGYHFHEDSWHVQFNGGEVRLQPLQFFLAVQFFRNVGVVVEREWLWKVLWKAPVQRLHKRTVDVCVSNVRKKLELNGEHGFLLRTVYRRGYQLIEC